MKKWERNPNHLNRKIDRNEQKNLRKNADGSLQDEIDCAVKKLNPETVKQSAENGAWKGVLDEVDINNQELIELYKKDKKEAENLCDPFTPAEVVVARRLLNIDMT